VPKAPIIYVVGDVGRPSGLLVDNGTLTVLQALALAGGPNHTAKMSGARLIHKTPSGMTEEHIQLKKMLEAKAPGFCRCSLDAASSRVSSPCAMPMVPA
jgi:protein involved in polysaccharide export with SLBB domain